MGVVQQDEDKQSVTHANSLAGGDKAVAPTGFKWRVRQLMETFREGGPVRHATVVVIGLDGAGKTTLSNALLGQGDRKVIPTVGINKPRVIPRGHNSRFEIKLLDMGGIASFRASWADRLATSHGAIFVVDASDRRRLLEARDELLANLATPAFDGKPVVILANKEDRCCVGNKELVDLFTLKTHNALRQSAWRVMSCVGHKAINGGEVDERLRDSLRWLQEEIEWKWKDISRRVKVAISEQQKSASARAADNKKSVALKRSGKASATVQPDAPAAVILCKNKITSGDQRLECRNPAVKRSALTGWQPFCVGCFEEAVKREKSKEDIPSEQTSLERVAQEQRQISKLEAFAKATQPNHLDGGEKKAKKDKKEKKEKKEKKSKDKKRVVDMFLTNAFVKDQRVEANFKKSNEWYPGKVTWVNADGSVSIQYDDGDTEDNVDPSRVLPMEGPILPNGIKVEVRYRGKNKFYPGIIQSINDDATTYTVTFDDGDKDDKVKRSWIRVLKF